MATSPRFRRIGTFAVESNFSLVCIGCGDGQRYNMAMPGAQPKRQPVANPEQAPKPHIYGLEATGLLIIALLILILTLARYWYRIPWNAR